jgi:hypothetical protein
MGEYFEPARRRAVTLRAAFRHVARRAPLIASNA